MSTTELDQQIIIKTIYKVIFMFDNPTVNQLAISRQ